MKCYDDILYGPSPEQLVEKTHKAIFDLLKSEKAASLFLSPVVDNEGSKSARDLLIKKIVEAVSPIPPNNQE